VFWWLVVHVVDLIFSHYSNPNLSISGITSPAAERFVGSVVRLSE
jgi:hypothetical protein